MSKQILTPNPAKIKVVGVGGGGCNAINHMVEAGIQGVEFIVMNTDAQALLLNQAPVKVQLGEKLTRGLGAGGDPRVGEKAAQESRDEIREQLQGADMVFIAAGMGGGTGTGGAPMVAQVSKETGALTIAVATRPFGFEGAHRKLQAEEGISKLGEYVDTLILIPNDRLLALCDSKTVVDNAFKLCDSVLHQAVRSIADVISIPGMINLDFADVKAIMLGAGPAWLAIGKGTGQNRASDAAKSALASPLLDVAIDGARSVLYTISGGQNLTLHEVNEAAQVIGKAVSAEANIIFGVNFDNSMDANEIRLTLIATGFRTKGGSLAPKPEEIRELASKMADESELDVPAFLRHPLTLRRQQMAARAAQDPYLRTPSNH